MGITSLSGLKILVVEDRFLVAQLHTQMLEDEGCHVIGPASSVKDALRLVDESAIDAGLLDVDLNGETCAPIAAKLRERGIPLVLCTGFDRLQIPPAFREVAVLAKPLDCTQLLAGIQASR